MKNIEFIQTLENIIQDRLQNPSKKSYTTTLVASGAKRIAKKVGEEGVELALASLEGNRDETISEAADLVYHMLVLLNSQGIRIEEVSRQLEARHKNS